MVLLKQAITKTTKFILKPLNRRFEPTNHDIYINNTCLQKVGKDQLEEGCKFT